MSKFNLNFYQFYINDELLTEIIYPDPIPSAIDVIKLFCDLS